VFLKVEDNIFVFKKATRGVVKIYNAGVVTHDRRIGSLIVHSNPRSTETTVM
jgi:hypothetical protein